MWLYILYENGIRFADEGGAGTVSKRVPSFIVKFWETKAKILDFEI